MENIRIRIIADSVERRIQNLKQLAMAHTPQEKFSTEDDVDENIAADYSVYKQNHL